MFKKLFICCVLFWVMLCFGSTSAQEQQPSINNIVYDGTEVFLNREIFKSSIDNSELEVTIIKQNGNTERVVHDGKLGEYDGGTWSGIDLQYNKLIAIFDWSQDEVQAMYIINKNLEDLDESIDTLPSMSSGVASENQVNMMSLDSSYETNIAFRNNDEYSETIKNGHNIIGIDLTVKNISGSSQSVRPYFVLYKNGNLFEAKLGQTQRLLRGQSITFTDTFTINKNPEDEYSVKVFNWNVSMVPLSKTYTITSNNDDFYGNTMKTATLIPDTTKAIKGIINTSGDIDYFKIYVPKSNSYTFYCFRDQKINMRLLKDNSAVLGKDTYTISSDLNKGYYYYIELSGKESTGEYELFIKINEDESERNFDIYEYDTIIAGYKEGIENTCNDLYDIDRENAKKLYSEYEKISEEDLKLHTLPDAITNLPKNTTDYDEKVVQYYHTKHNHFAELKEKYTDLIERYNIDTTETISDGYDIKGIQAQVYVPEKYDEQEEEHIELSSAENEPSIVINAVTDTTITFTATFPKDNTRGNAVMLASLSSSTGMANENYANYKGNYRDYTWQNGTYTIENLVPGGVYIVSLMWSTDGGESFGGENTIRQRVMLDYGYDEEKTLCNGQYVTANIENADKSKITDTVFNTWLSRMDKAYLKYKELTGFIPSNGRKLQFNSTRENLSELFDIPNGQDYWYIIAGYSGNPSQISQAFFRNILLRQNENDWGDILLHEMSHNFDKEIWSFDSEAMCYFKMYYVISELNAKVYREDVATYRNSYGPWYSGEEYYNYLKYDCFVGSPPYLDYGDYNSGVMASILIDIQREIGWEPFKKTFRYFNCFNSIEELTNEDNRLNAFLTKLKDYSGVDVISLISDEDKEIIGEFLWMPVKYINLKQPVLSDGDSDEGTPEINVSSDECMIFQFTAETSDIYYIYTSPYGGSGIPNDTCLEVYDNPQCDGTPIVANDDYDGGRFSKVSITATEGTTYYIKLYNYNGGLLQTKINFSNNIPVNILQKDEYVDIMVSKGDYALYTFSPQEDGVYTFAISSIENDTDDTYIKLYTNESLSNRIAYNPTKIIASLKANSTYYLQFSGFLMNEAQGRIVIRDSHTIKFNKASDRNFIFVNSPEYITRIDIVDDSCHIEPMNSKLEVQPHLKIFELENVFGENTFYETNTAWWGKDDEEVYFPQNEFYMDIDMYNPTSEPITVSIENLAYGTDYSILQQYFTGGHSFDITIQPYSHIPVFSYLGAPLLCTELTDNEWARIPVILFDFDVHSGNITISTLAAYNPTNLYLRYGTKNIIDNTGAALNKGDIIIPPDANKMTTILNTNDTTGRPNETDLYAKIKGIARNESAWVDSDIELLIDSNTKIGEKTPLNFADDYYDYGISNPKWSWMTCINPLSDRWSALLNALPGGLHNFKYHHNGEEDRWHFDFWHRDTRYIDENRDGAINDSVPAQIIEYAKQDVAAGYKVHFPDRYDSTTGENIGNAPDEYAVNMGEWGATYHYTVSVRNTTNLDRTANVNIWSAENMIFGLKHQSETEYTTTYYNFIANDPLSAETVASVSIPANETVTFEFVTLLGGGLGGLNHAIVIE